MTAAPNLISEQDRCPECGTEWAYHQNNRRYSKLVGVYDRMRDRTVAWRCPGCGEQWGREAVLGDPPEPF